MPKYSIIIPVYKVEDYIDNTVKSVLSQTFDDYEVILVDDESPAPCPGICDEYASRYDKIRAIHPSHSGLAGARNEGEKVALGDYLYFLDGDDTIQPDMLDDFERILSDVPDADMIFTDFQRVAIGEEFTPAEYDNGYELFEDRQMLQEGFMLTKYHILAPGSLFSRKWYREMGMHFKNNPFGEDQLFIYEALLRVRKAVHLKKPVYNYLSRPGSIMTASSRFRIAQAYPFIKELSKLYCGEKEASSLVQRYLLPRWCFSVCHSAEKLCSFAEFKEFAASVDADEYMSQLRAFPSGYVRVLSSAFCLSPRLFFVVCRILDALYPDNTKKFCKLPFVKTK